MKLVKTFLVSEIPEELQKWFRCSSGSFVKDGFGSYHVGTFVKEAAENPDNYEQKDVEACKKLDGWLKSSGAKDEEVVIFQHW